MESFMNEKEFQKWLETCPDPNWDEVQRFEGVVWIRFCVEEEHELTTESA